MKTILASFVFALTLSVACLVQAQTGDQSILLRNISLINQDGKGELLAVNILIKDRKLDIISEDTIPRSEADVTFDGVGGVIVGQLKLGAPASFMVLDGDPREDIDLLLDTKTHATFAIRKGQIVKNTFITITEETTEERQQSKQGWLAYAPPPLAVPMDYQDTSKWNRFDTKYVSGIGVGVIALDRQNWEGQDNDSHDQVGDLTDFEGGEIRGFRIGAVGTLNFSRPWVWTVFGATHAFDKGFDSEDDDDWTLFDLRLDIPIWEKASFSIGKQKEPISMERIMSLANSPQQERAAVSDALLPARNIGMVMSGTLLEDRMTLAGGIFNNWLDKHQPKSIDDNATQFVGRITGVPWMSSDASTLLHFGAGYRYSNAREDGRALTEPEFNQAPDFVDTGLFEADEVNTYQAEISLRSGPYWLHSEFVMGEVDAPDLGDPSFNGYHITASWVVTGEMRGYNKRVGIFDKFPIARDVNQNGWGAWELSTRFSSLDLNDGDIRGGAMDIWSAGVNWWMTPYMNFNLNYRHISLDRFGETGNSHGFNSRLTLVLE